ncbi:MAG: hypothetical protein Kow00121_51830 [Elainellaceae cyanobacterium]
MSKDLNSVAQTFAKPTLQRVFSSLVNIRPGIGNRSMEIQNSAIREQIHHIVQNLLGNVQWQ